MFKLLNRFAWVISLLSGYIIGIYLMGSFIGYYSGNIIVFIVSLIIGSIFKKIFLSKFFIENRITFFADSLEENILSNFKNKSRIDAVSTKQVINKESEEYYEDDKKENIFRNIPLVMSDVKDIEEKSTKTVENKVINEEIISEPSNGEIYLTKTGNYIKNFFSDNILAKIGGIIIFVVVLLLLRIGFDNAGDFERIIMGTVIGFTSYGVGVWLEKKGLQNEAIVLLGIGLLINFLVILSGRYLLGDSSSGPFLSSGLTFFFLILNTIFAVVTSFVYKSRTLLVFGFLSAFLNPFLIGDNSIKTPYIIVGYSLIISLGGLFLGLKKNDLILSIGVFVLGNILLLSAPTSTDIGWVTVLIGTCILGVSTLYVIYKNNKKFLSLIFGLNYLFIITLLMGAGDILSGTTAYIGYMFSILFFFGIGIYYLLAISSTFVYQIFIFPILIVLGLIFSGTIIYLPFSILLIVIVYLFAFVFIGNNLSNILKYFFFLILGIFIFSANGYIGFSYPKIDLTIIEFITTIIVSFIFLFSSYYLSRKKDLEFLYSIGTIGGIITLLPILKVGYSKLSCKLGDITCINGNDTQIKISIIAISIFAILNWLLPFVNKKLTREKSSFKNLLIGSVAGILFIGFQLFRYGNEYFSGVMTGMAFMLLAIVYFVLSFFMIQRIGIENIQGDKENGTKKNTILSYLGISISLFSFAIAFVFQDSKEIVSAVWLFEATILFFFYGRIKEYKIYIAGLILFFIGVFDLFNLLDVVRHRSIGGLTPLISLSIVFISFVLNLKFLESFNKKGNKKTTGHDILHILGIGVLGLLLYKIIGSNGHGWSTLSVSLFIVILSGLYAYFNFKILKNIFVVFFILFLVSHFLRIYGTYRILRRDDVEYLKILQYISTGLLGLALYVWNKYNISKNLNKVLYISFAIYLLIITSIYIENIFGSTFAITMYWGVLSFVFISYGLQKNLIRYRTLGLYLLSLTTVKIFPFDIFYGIDDNTTRVIVFGIVGVLFLVISSAYSKKLGGSLKGEFDFKNFNSGSNDDINKKKID